MGWYGFGLDGTLARRSDRKDISSIGAPVVPVVRMLRAISGAGHDVKVVTDRVAPDAPEVSLPNPYAVDRMAIERPDSMPWALKDRWTAREFVQEWCWRNIGFVPDIVPHSDADMLSLFDCRVTQVEPDTGRILGRLPVELNIYAARRGKYVEKACAGCGKTELMYSSAKYCSACRAARVKAANQAAYIRRAMAG